MFDPFKELASKWLKSEQLPLNENLTFVEVYSCNTGCILGMLCYHLAEEQLLSNLCRFSHSLMYTMQQS